LKGNLKIYSNNIDAILREFLAMFEELCPVQGGKRVQNMLAILINKEIVFANKSFMSSCSSF
jgi:hypothetical protein